jgi:hypothetical protein
MSGRLIFSEIILNSNRPGGLIHKIEEEMLIDHPLQYSGIPVLLCPISEVRNNQDSVPQ